MVLLMLKVFGALVCAVVAVELGVRVVRAWQRIARRSVRRRLELQLLRERKAE